MSNKLTENEKKLADIIFDLGDMHSKAERDVKDSQTDAYALYVLCDFLNSVRNTRLLMLRLLSDEQKRYLTESENRGTYAKLFMESLMV